MTMRLLLIAPFDSIDATEDAQLLKMRGYDALTFQYLYSPKYTYNNGCMPTERWAWHNLCVEMVHGTLAVIHPDAKPAQIAEVAKLCQAMKVHLVHLQDLPACPPESTEVLDAANCVADPFRLRMVHPAHVGQMCLALQGGPDEDGVAPCAERPKGRAEGADTVQPKWALVRRTLLRWGRVLLGHLASKNPMSTGEVLRPTPRPYPVPEHALSKTG